MPPSRRNADARLSALWRGRGALVCLLFPFSLLFRIVVALRRHFYRAGIFRSERLPLPVVVVGNITVGGSGKTPLVIHLALALRAIGRYPGIVSRGYRGAAADVAEATPDGDPAILGDEALVLVRRSGCPVFVGRDRPAAARALLAAHPECDLILSDDGLQHYALQRDIELAVFDQRGLMNGWCLPAGPLREPVSRLAQVDAVVINGSAVAPALTFAGVQFRMDLRSGRFYKLDDPQIERDAAELAGKHLHAVAGIGDPQRFFEQLRALGLGFAEHPFPDHHDFCETDLAYSGDAILTTEKDAVKLNRLFSPLPVWVFPVTAEVSPDLAAFVQEKLDGHPPA